MQRKEHNGISWLEFDHLGECPKLRHGVFLRHGGHSQGPFQSLNCHDQLGDNLQHVQSNRKAILNILQLTQYAIARLEHGKTICSTTSPAELNGDGLLTDKSHLGLMITHADCQAAIFYDPIHHVVANVHAGWRGSAQNIYREAIAKMSAKYGTKPEELLVGISPSLGPDAAQFIHFKTELPEAFWRFQVKPLYFDFWAISEWQLQECGVLPHHIEIARICTFSNPIDYFSYRRDSLTGRHATCITLL